MSGVIREKGDGSELQPPAILDLHVPIHLLLVYATLFYIPFLLYLGLFLAYFLFSALCVGSFALILTLL